MIANIAVIWQMFSVGMTREIPLTEKHGTTHWAEPDFFFSFLVVVVGFAKLGGVLRLLEHQMINQANLISHMLLLPLSTPSVMCLCIRKC